MWSHVIKFVFLTATVCLGVDVPATSYQQASNLHHGLTERIGNFSIEFLYHVSKVQPRATNLIISPFTVWSVLAVTSEGATGPTLSQINNVIRLTVSNRDRVRSEYKSIAQHLQVKTKAVELAKVNAMFVDENSLPLPDFREDAKSEYDADVVPLDFTKSELAADVVNRVISNVTQGHIPKLVDSTFFSDSHMVLTSAVYFKGQWTVPFNASSTEKKPFFDSEGNKIGEVNMMYNSHTYPLANIPELQARVLELPYGKENRLSMVVMLPLPGVSLENMFLNFNNITIDKMFEELRIAREEYGDDEVHCYLPRFKIESNLDLTPILRDRLGVEDLFDPTKARLTKIARTPLHVSRIIHKAEIEVTEEGTTASGVTVADFSNRFGVIPFEANRPFSYVIIEKTTNSIVFGGFYQEPSLY
jgi:serine protease inhibitor